MGDKGSLPLVSILDPDVVITPANIKLGEDLSSFELVHEIGDEREGLGISDSVFVQIAVVLAGAETTILLFDKEEGCSLGRV